MIDAVKIQLKDAEKTASTGHSLASSLYNFPLDIHLIGPLGAGKTTFVQGLTKGLGISGPVLSPTYALEQRYTDKHDRPFIHIDLYRIDPSRCRELLAASDDHEGIRCIEWADRLDSDVPDTPRITIRLSEGGDGRLCSIDFDDIPLPSTSQIEQWQEAVRLPKHIIAHCQGVAAIGARVTEYLASQGMVVRPTAVERSGLVHDLLRFVDFKHSPDQGFIDPEEDIAHWKMIANNFPELKHEEACATFLQEKGFDALASIVEVHGLRLPSPERVTIEQKVLFYADKRVAIDKVVTVEERFQDFRNRYNKGDISPEGIAWYTEAINLEKELFPDGPPF